MTTIPLFAQERLKFHARLLESTLTTNDKGVVSNADGSNATSIKIAAGIAEQLKAEVVSERLAGQTSGSNFESICASFLRATFPHLQHLRPGNWDIHQVVGRNRLEIAKYAQYSHLIALDKAARSDPELAAALGNDYTITPDIVVARMPVSDAEINAERNLVDDEVALHSIFRSRQLLRASLPVLHASISCKWTIRSDRAQNARSEALNLIRNRKGPLPHIAVVTAEPTPSRLASIALGTGDIDCVYHFALPELVATLNDQHIPGALEQLNMMVQGGRLKDIADLPLDLAA